MNYTVNNAASFPLGNKILMLNSYSNIDIYYGPWDSLSDADAAFTEKNLEKQLGLTIGIINQDGKVQEYWWLKVFYDKASIPADEIGTIYFTDDTGNTYKYQWVEKLASSTLLPGLNNLVYTTIVNEDGTSELVWRNLQTTKDITILGWNNLIGSGNYHINDVVPAGTTFDSLLLDFFTREEDPTTPTLPTVEVDKSTIKVVGWVNQSVLPESQNIIIHNGRFNPDFYEISQPIPDITFLLNSSNYNLSSYTPLSIPYLTDEIVIPNFGTTNNNVDINIPYTVHNKPVNNAGIETNIGKLVDGNLTATYKLELIGEMKAYSTGTFLTVTLLENLIKNYNTFSTTLNPRVQPNTTLTDFSNGNYLYLGFGSLGQLNTAPWIIWLYNGYEITECHIYVPYSNDDAKNWIRIENPNKESRMPAMPYYGWYLFAHNRFGASVCRLTINKLTT